VLGKSITRAASRLLHVLLVNPNYLARPDVSFWFAKNKKIKIAPVLQESFEQLTHFTKVVILTAHFPLLDTSQ